LLARQEAYRQYAAVSAKTKARRVAAVSESLSTAAPVKSPKITTTKKKVAEFGGKAEKKLKKIEPAKLQKPAKKSAEAATTAKSTPTPKSKSAKELREPKAPKEPEELKAKSAPVLQSQKKTSKPYRPTLSPEVVATPRPAQIPPTTPTSTIQVAADAAAPSEVTMEDRWKASANRTLPGAGEKDIEAKKKAMARRYMAILVSLPILIVTSYFLFIERRK